MDKLKMHSPDLSQDNIAKIRALFPDCVTEAADDQGTVRLAVDFDQLRQTLSDQIVDGPQERYRLDWPGKREALLTANAPIAKTLRPAREESVDFDTTQNLFIEGDNLDALKLLQESVRRQNIWHNSRRRFAECGPRLGVDVKRRACGVASADIRWSVV